MKIILQVNGGIGKSVAATAVCRAIKTQHPNSELTVITGYPDVFAGNPVVDRVLGLNELSYFYANHIDGRPDTRLLFHDPYLETDFVQRRGHLIEVWCRMFGIPYNGELPELYITSKEQSAYAGMFQSPKPILALQTSGGVPNQNDKYSWPRDLPPATAQQVVNALAGEYNIVHIRRQDQLPLQNTYPVHAEFRALAVLLQMSAKRLLIDSFAQHTAAALGLPSVVCWIANTPAQFGYGMHTNIIAHPPTRRPDLRNSVLAQFNITGPPAEFPYNSEDELFNVEQLVAIVRNGIAQPAGALPALVDTAPEPEVVPVPPAPSAKGRKKEVAEN